MQRAHWVQVLDPFSSQLPLQIDGHARMSGFQQLDPLTKEDVPARLSMSRM